MLAASAAPGRLHSLLRPMPDKLRRPLPTTPQAEHLPTRLGQRFSPDFGGTPTAIAPHDLAIWRRWYPTVRPPPIELYFNVGVGFGRPAGDDATPNDREYWRTVTQKRIDALLVFPDYVALVELRHDANANSIGRLLTYTTLLRDDNPFRVPVVTYLVTDNYDPDIYQLCRRHRIIYNVSPGEDDRAT